MAVPHTIPYQGSKRKLAERIFTTFPPRVSRMYEPFAGSAAMTIFAAKNSYAKEYVIADCLAPLVELHRMIIETPKDASDEYSEIWHGRGDDHLEYFYAIRERYNKYRRPIDLLYCIARCVANAVRFGKNDRFTQSVDKRRLGMKPEKMAKNIFQVSDLLKGRTEFRTGDWLTTVRDATPDDLIYMDPPYQGTSIGRDKRYSQQLSFEKICEGLNWMNEKGLRFALSYDGSTGKKTYGPKLPGSLNLKRVELNAGVSSQATLNGKKEVTIESLYLSAEMNDLAHKRLEQQASLLAV